MAIDLFIFGVLLISFLINLVALGAFWVTPGLRTTGNRFTINLLVINLTGCFILTPTLFLDFMSRVDSTTGLLRNTESVDDSIHSNHTNHQMFINHNGNIGERENVTLNVTAEVEIKTPNPNATQSYAKTNYKCRSEFCNELTIKRTKSEFLVTEISNRRSFPDATEQLIGVDGIGWLSDTSELRYWSIDLAAALGSLAVLLIVADTWCAITDPLRYHARISGMKTWIFIAITWLLGFIFAGLSAVRYMDFQTNTPLALTKTYTKGIYEMTFATFYFVIIIMLPFGFVCGMYWRIFKEARQNGLRMRQNGSSPLLQSSLNLNNQQLCAPNQLTSIICDPKNVAATTLSQDILVGVQMKNDGVKSMSNYKANSTPKFKNMISDRNYNIILTVQVQSGEIKPNYSTRQLSLLSQSSNELNEDTVLKGIRQVNSSPNLQPYTPGNAEPNSSHLLPHKPINADQYLIRLPSLPCYVFNNKRHQDTPRTPSYMTSLKHRLSNASSLFRYREESRAARISVLVVIMFLVSYVSYGFLVLIQSCVSDFPYSNQMAVLMILLANLSSPFLFAYRNKRVRRGLNRLFGLEIRGKLNTKCQSSSCDRNSSAMLEEIGVRKIHSNIQNV